MRRCINECLQLAQPNDRVIVIVKSAVGVFCSLKPRLERSWEGSGGWGGSSAAASCRSGLWYALWTCVYFRDCTFPGWTVGEEGGRGGRGWKEGGRGGRGGGRGGIEGGRERRERKERR